LEIPVKAPAVPPESGKNAGITTWTAGVALVLLTAVACKMPRGESTVPTIAVIPQSAGGLLWEVEHFGATMGAEKRKCRLYWNAPTSENDIAGQVSLIDKVVRGRYQGLIVAPNHPLAILAPLRRAIAAGIPVVVVSAQLDIPASSKLGYLVNDDETMGQLAAAEMARLLHGKGSVALVGLTRDAPGVICRIRGAEHFLAERFPLIQVVGRSGGAFDSARAEQFTGNTVDAHPGLNGVLSFTSLSTRGVHAALKSRSLQAAVRQVGCEQDSDLIDYIGNGEIAAVVAENTYRMGHDAVQLISEALSGKALPVRSLVAPFLITRENFRSVEAKLFTGISR
jgi:ribose transport system substrate-binding protein